MKKRIEDYVEAKKKYEYNIKNKIKCSEAQEAAARRNFHHLMSARFFESDDVKQYRNIDFETDFYKFIQEIYLSAYPNEDVKSREKVKIIIRIWMNLTDPHKRIKIKNLEFLKKLFPTIETLISEIGFFNTIKTAFSHLLQRAESHLVLDVLSKKIVENYPSTRIFTIHDSILIEDDGIIDVNNAISLMKNCLQEYTNLIPGVKKKEGNPFDSLDEIIKEDFKKVRKKARVDESKIVKKNERIFNSITQRWVELGFREIGFTDRVLEDKEQFSELLKKLYND